MEYFKDLPEVMYSGTDEKGIAEFEVRGQIKKPDESNPQDIVFVGRIGRTIYLVFGDVVEYEYIPPEKSQSGNAFTRLKIDGTCVTIF